MYVGSDQQNVDLHLSSSLNKSSKAPPASRGDYTSETPKPTINLAITATAAVLDATVYGFDSLPGGWLKIIAGGLIYEASQTTQLVNRYRAGFVDWVRLGREGRETYRRDFDERPRDPIRRTPVVQSRRQPRRK
jgi:hypothetical protein